MNAREEYPTPRSHRTAPEFNVSCAFACFPYSLIPGVLQLNQTRRRTVRTALLVIIGGSLMIPSGSTAATPR